MGKLRPRKESDFCKLTQLPSPADPASGQGTPAAGEVLRVLREGGSIQAAFSLVRKDEGMEVAPLSPLPGFSCHDNMAYILGVYWNIVFFLFFFYFF